MLLSILVLIVALLVGGGFWVVNALRGAFTPPLSVGCVATVGTDSYNLAPDQSANAGLIAGVALQRGLPARAASIALATAIQESKLRNIEYGDMDSLGLFQQRPSQEWGTAQQIMNPVYSTNAFYAELEAVPDYLTIPITDAAQAVQRSAFPSAYAAHEGTARAFASALTGQSPAALNCTLFPLKDGEVVSTSSNLQTALRDDLGQTNVTVPSQGGVRIGATSSTGWAAAQWAVANADEFGLTSVSFDGHRWDRNANKGSANVGWQADPSAAADRVDIAIATKPAA